MQDVQALSNECDKGGSDSCEDPEFHLRPPVADFAAAALQAESCFAGGPLPRSADLSERLHPA